MSKHAELQNAQFQDMQAQTILMLAKEHKKNCEGDCGFTLFVLFPLYKKIKGEGALQDMEHFI